MCFSMTADLVVGTALVPVAAASLKLVRNRREVLFAALPALFALHQFMEVAVWAGLDGDVSPGLAELAMRAYLFIAWPLLPTYVPLAVMLLEPPERAGRGLRRSSSWASSSRPTWHTWSCSIRSR